MKNYLKLKSLFFITIIIVLLVSSCSKDDSGSSSNNGKVEFLLSVTENGGDKTYPRYSGKDTLVYENGRVIKSFVTAGCHGSAYQYEYGNNGKISKVYRSFGGSMEDLIEMFENSTIHEDGGSTILLEYDSKNRLIQINDDFNPIRFEYDDKGRAFKKTYLDQDIVYTVYEFDENGNPLVVTRKNGHIISDETYRYGSLKNPYYDLLQEYGLVLANCILDHTFTSPNVVTHYSSSIHTYYSEGEYPSSVHSENNGFRSVFDFTYR